MLIKDHSNTCQTAKDSDALGIRLGSSHIWRIAVEAETPVLWPPDARNWLIWKDPDSRKDWRWKEKGTTEDEMVGWHHWLNGHESEETLVVGEGQGGLACCSLWGHKELDTTEQLNWTKEPQYSKVRERGIWVRGKVINIIYSFIISFWHEQCSSSTVFLSCWGGIISILHVTSSSRTR